MRLRKLEPLNQTAMGMRGAMANRRSGAARMGCAVGVAVLAGVLFTMPLDGWPDPRTLLPWGLSLEVTAHLVIAAGVVFTWGVAFPEVRPLRLLLWGLLFAVAAEALQLLPLAADRNVRLDDAAANVLSAAIGWALAMGWRRKGEPAPGERVGGENRPTED